MHLKNSILNFRKNINLSIPICGLSLLTFAIILIHSYGNSGTAKTLPAGSYATLLPAISLPRINLADSKTYKGLPIRDVKSYSAQNTWGTVIFIPQYHQYPGTNPQDPTNDSAEKAQKEIYQILDFINKTANVDLIMTEGDLYGKVPVEKIAFLADKIEKRNALERSCKTLEEIFKKKSLDSSLERKLIATIDDQIKKADREIILSGAPVKLAAESKKIILFGSENKATREKSADLVRDYIYLQDREKQIQTPQQDRLGDYSSSLSIGKSSFTDEQLMQLEQLFSERNIDGLFTTLASIANSQGQKELAKIIREAQDSFNKLAQPQKTTTAIAATDQSRSNNPYNHINDEKTIKKMLNEDEEKIQNLIVDRRNKETAQNFAKMLKEQHKQTGILQFGAGHEEGLIKELNNQGLSVITITSNEVLNRNLKGQ